MQHFQSGIKSLPLELVWEVIKYLDLSSSLRFCIFLNLSKEIAYRNHHLKLEIKDIWQWVNDIEFKTDRNPKYFEALIHNPRWKLYFGEEETLTLSCGFGHLERVKDLCKSVDPSCFFNFPIILASRNGRQSVVEFLLKDDRVDPSDRFNSALRLSCQNGHLSVVELLLDHGDVEPSDLDNSAIKSALLNKNLDIVKRLLDDARMIRDGLEDMFEI
jgi:hypothetical protein